MLVIKTIKKVTHNLKVAKYTKDMEMEINKKNNENFKAMKI